MFSERGGFCTEPRALQPDLFFGVFPSLTSAGGDVYGSPANPTPSAQTRAAPGTWALREPPPSLWLSCWHSLASKWHHHPPPNICLPVHPRQPLCLDPSSSFIPAAHPEGPVSTFFATSQLRPHHLTWLKWLFNLSPAPA